jgi:type I restriction enzyme M protein
MAIKKSELYSSLWAGCDELRGGMDASQYKDYVLVLLFMKYVSDKAASQKGYLLDVPKGGSFVDMVALKHDKEIGDKINKIIAKLAGANDLKGVIDVADFNDADKLGKGKDMVDRLSKLVAIFEDLDFGRNRAEGDDLLGDAYEYLMRHFATESGKSKGQFYTPAEVSRIMAKVIGVGDAKSATQTIHDPTCGSGSLLLKAHDEAKERTGLDLALYGQEMDNATKALAKMNMILHDCATADIWQDNSVSSPHFKDAKTGALKTFDFVVANPPFSTKAWSNGLNSGEDEFHRFEFGIPPMKNGDYAFLLHVLACLKSTGKGAIILPHGVLFRSGAEANIRREIVKRGYIKGIIGLPANLFYGTGIPACILVLDREHAHARKGIFMIDASKGFIKDGNKNRLRAQNIHKIVDAFTRQAELPRYSRMVSRAEISDQKNDFNLNLPRYIDSTEPEDLQDIDGHLRGGIPNRDIDELERYWQVIPGVRATLFKKADRPGYSQLRVAASDIKAAIFGHAEFTAFNESTTKLFTKWKTANTPRLKGLDRSTKPKSFIETLAEDLLGTFEKAKLLDPYDMYQHLMDYWAETMQDDLYMIVSDGWREAAKPRLIIED